MGDSTHYQGVQKASSGFKLLKSMGWSEGEGLGANKQGLKEHIRVKKKFEMWGVGAVESHNRTSNWSNGMSEFHRVLSSLSEITSKHADGSGSEEDDGGVEVEDRSVGRGKNEGRGDEGKAKKRDKKKEKKRLQEKKRKRKDKMEDNGADKKSAEEGVVAVREKGEKKKATHIGRFKRRESSKMVKGYSSSDLAAILGEDPFAKQAAMETIKNTVDQAGSSSDDDEPGPEPVATGHPSAEASKLNKAQVDAWWAGYFMVGPRAGSRGEKAAIKKKGKKVGFSEADQEALDTWAHSHATHGKVGLGRSSLKKTIGGAKWEGTKTKLGSDSDDDEAAVVIDEEEIGDDGGQEDGVIEIVMPQKRAAVDAGSAGDVHPVDDNALRQVRDLLNKEKKKELKVKVLAKAVNISKESLVERLEAKPIDFKLSRSKSRVRLL